MMSYRPDAHMAWIYDYNDPRYSSDEARDLRDRRSRALARLPGYMRPMGWEQTTTPRAGGRDDEG